MNIELPPDILTYTLLMLALLAVYHNMIIVPMVTKLQNTRQKGNEHFAVESPQYYRKPKRIRKRVPIHNEQQYVYVNKQEPKARKPVEPKYPKNNRVPKQKKKKMNYAMNVNPNNIDNRLFSCQSTVNSLEDKRTELPKYNSYEYIDQQDVDYNPAMNSYHASSQQDHNNQQNVCSFQRNVEPSNEYYDEDSNSDDSDSDDHY